MEYFAELKRFHFFIDYIYVIYMCGYELLFGGEVLLFLLAVFDFCVEFIGFLYAKIFQTPKGIDTTNNIGVITKRNIFGSI